MDIRVGILMIISTGIMTACSFGFKPIVSKPLPVSDSARTPPYQRDLQNGQEYYEVKKGDTLYAIGFRSGHGYKTLALWNNIHPPYRLMVGQRIKLFDPIAIKNKGISSVGAPQTSLQTLDKKRFLSQKKPILSTDNKNMLKLHWQWPITGQVVKSFAQSGNKGIDIGGHLGEWVRAAEAGKVVYSGSGLIGYGKLLIIKHNEMYLSAYANNSNLLVEEGQVVNKGQVVAELGKVGSSRPLLHFEIRKNGKPVNPVNYLPRK